MSLKETLSISGRPGLYQLAGRGRNMLICQSLVDGKRIPAYAKDRAIALSDISIYTMDGDKPLPEVLEAVRASADSQPIDPAAVEDVHAWFATVLPDYDRERVHTSDIRKLLSWYNLLVSKGITDFLDAPAPEEGTPDQPAAE